MGQLHASGSAAVSHQPVPASSAIDDGPESLTATQPPSLSLVPASRIGTAKYLNGGLHPVPVPLGRLQRPNFTHISVRTAHRTLRQTSTALVPVGHWAYDVLKPCEAGICHFQGPRTMASWPVGT